MLITTKKSQTGSSPLKSKTSEAAVAVVATAIPGGKNKASIWREYAKKATSSGGVNEFIVDTKICGGGNKDTSLSTL